VREIQEAFPERNRPAYTTVQTTVYRLEAKKAVRRVKKVGSSQPVVAHLIDTGKLTLEDVKEAELTLRRLREGKDKPR
jgi:predicted transcriptional regulator